MKRSLYILHRAPSRNFALAGRAPICWLRDLTLGVSKIRSLRLASAWIGPLTRMFPALRDGPLFGRSIAELVEAVITKSAADAAHQARSSRRGTGQPSAARAAPANRSAGNSVVERSHTRQARAFGAAKPRATRAQPPNKTDRLRPRNRSGFGDSTGVSCFDSYESDAQSLQAQTRAAEVAQLPQRAGRELLENRANAPQHVQQVNGEPQSHAGSPTPRSSPSDQPGEAAAPYTRQSRVSTKPRGAVNAISQRRVDYRPTGVSAGETFSQRLVRRAGNTIRRLRFSSNEEPRASEPLAEQWSTPLAGTAVPTDWLRGVATGETRAMSASRSAAERRHSSPVAPHRQTATVQSPNEHSFSSVNTLDECSPPFGEQPRTLAPKSVGDSFGDSFGDQREDSENTANRGGFERIAPPSLQAPLPALSPLTPRQTAVTGALPLASETARQAAREEARPSEDLDALAAKIKFILDEQARRHGIDV